MIRDAYGCGTAQIFPAPSVESRASKPALAELINIQHGIAAEFANLTEIAGNIADRLLGPEPSPNGNGVDGTQPVPAGALEDLGRVQRAMERTASVLRHQLERVASAIGG